VTHTLAKPPGDDRKPMVGDLLQTAPDEWGETQEWWLDSEDEVDLFGVRCDPRLWTLVGRVVPSPERYVPVIRDVIDREQAFLDAHPGDESVTADLATWRSLLAVITGEAS